MPRWLLALVLVGCGRIDIDPVVEQDGGAQDGGAQDGGSQGPQRWGLVQAAGTQSATVTVTRLGAHHLVVVAIQLTGGLVTAITDSSNCNTYAAISTAHAANRTLGEDLEIFYAKDSCPGADAISIAATTSVAAAVIWEVSGMRTDDPVDTAVALNDQPRSTTPLGPPITTRTEGEFVVSVAMVANSVSGIHPGNEFTNDEESNNNGWGHLTDPQAAAGVHQAQWDQPQVGVYCATAAAFLVAP